MKAYIISLKSPDDAGNPKLRATLEKHDFEVEFIAAVNGKKMPAGDYFAATRGYLRATGRMMTPSEVGCGMSHIAVYRRVVETGEPCALVLEDDAILDDASCETIHKLVALKLHEQGFLHLGGQEGLEDSIGEARGRLLPGDLEIWDVNRDDWDNVYRSVGYVLALPLAKKLVALADRGVFISDDFPYYLGATDTDHIYLCNVVGHPVDLGNSAIESERAAARAAKKANRSLAARLQNELKRTVEYRLETLKKAKRAKGYEPIKLAKRPTSAGAR